MTDPTRWSGAWRHCVPPHLRGACLPQGRRRMRPLVLAIAAGLALATPGVSTVAATRTWTGGGQTTDNWSNENNWNGGTDISTTGRDRLVFAADGAQRLTTGVQNLANLSILGLSYNSFAGMSVIGGSESLTILGEGITSTATLRQTLSMPIIVGANQTWDGGTGGLTINALSAVGNRSLSITNNVEVHGTQRIDVGSTGTGSLVLSGNSQLSAILVVGNGSSAVGTVTIDGSGDSRSGAERTELLAASLVIGGAGTGTMTVDGGVLAVSLSTLKLGESATGHGTLQVVDGVVGVTGNVSIGVAGTGELNFQKGGLYDRSCFNCRHTVTIGEFAGSRGTVTLGSSTSTASISRADALIVGKAGSGQLTIGNGSRADSITGHVGGFQTDYSNPSTDFNGTGRVTVGGANAVWDIAQTLYVGGLRASGQLDIFEGKLNSGDAVVDGSVLVSGAQGRWTNTSNITVGLWNNGHIMVDNGAVLSTGSGNSVLGFYFDSDVTLIARGATWNAAGSVLVGGTAAATLNIQNQSLMVTPSLTIGVPGTVNLAGGELRVGRMDPQGSFNWTAGTLNITGADGARLGTGGLAADQALPTGKTLQVAQALAVDFGRTVRLQGGSLRVGSLALNGGMLETASNASFEGVVNWNSGTINLTDAGAARLDTPLFGGTLRVGPTHTLRAAHGLDVVPGTTLTLAGGTTGVGTLTLDGGTLATGNTTLLTDRFQWNTGTLQLTAADGAALGAGWLAPTVVLRNGQTLQVDRTLNVPGDTTLLLSGGGLQAQTLHLTGGTLTSTSGAVNLGLSGGDTAGHGTIAAATTLPAGRTLTVSGGAMAVGDLGNANGFAAVGTIVVDPHQSLTLLDADQAALGALTVLGDNSRLVSFHGASLAQGRVLRYDVPDQGVARIQGDFVNNGQVLAGTTGAGRLQFLNAVSGIGSFSGHLVFSGSHSPGNSPGQVRFGGGDATYDATSELTMEILGRTPGTQYDQLLDIGTLRFDGQLHIVFGNGFTPQAGDAFQLFSYEQFAGAFTPDRIDVTGFEGTRLDFARLGQDGSFSVTAVPEPNSWAMLAAGLGLMGLIARRQRNRKEA